MSSRRATWQAGFNRACRTPAEPTISCASPPGPLLAVADATVDWLEQGEDVPVADLVRLAAAKASRDRPVPAGAKTRRSAMGPCPRIWPRTSVA